MAVQNVNNNFKVSDYKAAARKLVKRKGIKRYSIFLLTMFLPMLITTILSIISNSFGTILGMIIYTVTFIIQLLAISAFTSSVSKIVTFGDGRLKFELNQNIFSVFVLMSLVLSILQQFLFTSWFGIIFYFVLEFLFILLCMPIIFLVALRNYPFPVAVKEGIKLGHEFYFPLFKMGISFIPLLILCGLTFGIVAIFKGTYIYTSFALLCRDIFDRARTF